ncbi:MAG: metal ABC transporter solute-binding protein, Zn/Mn family [Candidatus Zixiibacteriota bacterium]
MIRFLTKPTIFLLVLSKLTPFLAVAESLDKQLKVFVSILPQAYFVERVGESHVKVEVLVEPGLSPETFEPTPQQLARLAQADLYFRIGLPFEERLLEKIHATMRDLPIVDTRQSIKLRTLNSDHEDVNTDPHIWLDPKLVSIQAETICEALIHLDSSHSVEYQANLQAFQTDLNNTDVKISQILEPLKGQKFYVFHPSFGYFADAYGLIQTAVEVDGKEPSAKQLTVLIDDARREDVKVIFFQPQFSSKSAESVAKAIGGTVAPLDPLSPDYLGNLEDIAKKIDRALRGKGD